MGMMNKNLTGIMNILTVFWTLMMMMTMTMMMRRMMMTMLMMTMIVKSFIQLLTDHFLLQLTQLPALRCFIYKDDAEFGGCLFVCSTLGLFVWSFVCLHWSVCFSHMSVCFFAFVCLSICQFFLPICLFYFSWWLFSSHFASIRCSADASRLSSFFSHQSLPQDSIILCEFWKICSGKYCVCSCQLDCNRSILFCWCCNTFILISRKSMHCSIVHILKKKSYVQN